MKRISDVLHLAGHAQKPGALAPRSSASVTEDRRRTGRAQDDVVGSFNRLTTDQQIHHIADSHHKHVDPDDNLAAVHRDLHRGSVNHVHFSAF